jgi:hypothetical protein
MSLAHRCTFAFHRQRLHLRREDCRSGSGKAHQRAPNDAELE